MYQIISLIILSIILIFCASLIFAYLSLAPWVPTRGRDLKRVFKLAGLKPGEVFYDLGCGDGRLVIEAAKKYGADARGIEMTLPFYFHCLVRKLFCGKKTVKFKLKNLFAEDLSPANVIYFFGLPDSINLRLKEKLLKEAKPGTRIISYAFKLTGLVPEAIDKPTDDDLPIYLYKR
jgi:hypothetical protein